MDIAADVLARRSLPGRWLASPGEAGAWGAGQRTPARAGDESCGLLFDGALYNPAELSSRSERARAGAAGDAELVLRAYHGCGESFLRKIQGIFALILWDNKRDLLLCARDPVGVYPLFYAESGGRLLFSTSIGELIRHPSVSAEVNRAALADHLCHRWPRAEETFFRSVKRVPPGHVLRVRQGAREVYRYWDPAPPGAPVNWIREDELEQFKVLLDQAVNRCLEFGPAGIYLSGGLDSVSIAAVAAEKTRDQGLPVPWALSIGFPHPDCNEQEIQTRVAADLGLPLQLVAFDDAVGPRGFLGAALELSSRLPAPLQNVWLPAYVHLAQEGKRRDCQVILTGSGGDEWLTVTPRYAGDLLSDLDLAGFYRLWRSIQRSYSLPFFSGLRNVAWTNGARPLLGDRAAHLLRRFAPSALRQRRLRRLFVATPDWIAPDSALRRELTRRAEQTVEEGMDRAPEGGFYWRDVRSTLEHPLMIMESEEVFEYARQVGVRVLHPYWDAALVDFLYRTPPDLLNQGGRNKGLVRRSLARRFPQLGFERQKKVSSIEFFRSAVFEAHEKAWRETGGAPCLEAIGVADGKGLRAAVAATLGNRHPRAAELIWDVLNIEAWVRNRV